MRWTLMVDHAPRSTAREWRYTMIAPIHPLGVALRVSSTTHSWEKNRTLNRVQRISEFTMHFRTCRRFACIFSWQLWDNLSVVLTEYGQILFCNIFIGDRISKRSAKLRKTFSEIFSVKSLNFQVVKTFNCTYNAVYKNESVHFQFKCHKNCSTKSRVAKVARNVGFSCTKLKHIPDWNEPVWLYTRSNGKRRKIKESSTTIAFLTLYGSSMEELPKMKDQPQELWLKGNAGPALVFSQTSRNDFPLYQITVDDKLRGVIIESGKRQKGP